MDTAAPTHTNWWWGEVNTNVARLYIQATDNVGISRVACPTSTQSGGYGNWYWFDAVWDAGANAYRADITPATFGHYNQTYITHLYIWDHAGNGGYYNQTSVGIPMKTYEVGDEVIVGGEQFYVLDWNTSSDTATLLAKYNLNREGTAQSTSFVSCKFSNDTYWRHILNNWSGIFDLNNVEGYASTDAMGKAKSYGSNKGAISSRLLTYDEATSLLPILGKEPPLWIGAARDEYYVYAVDARWGLCAAPIGDYDAAGVRPVITVLKSSVS